MSLPLTVSEMQANVAQSKKHVAKQEAIIARLTEQGHHGLAAQARGVLLTMNGHLATEVELLGRMETDAARRKT